MCSLKKSKLTEPFIPNLLANVSLSDTFMNQLQIATVLQFGKNLKHTVGSCVLGSDDVEKETLKKTRVVES